MTTVSLKTTTYNFGFRGVLSHTKSDSNAKCKACGFKYPLEQLTKFGGHLICKFCLKDMERNLCIK